MDPARWEEIKANIFPGESGGDYNALFGYSNRPGGQFANVNLTGMTVNDAIRFSDPSGAYGQWVKQTRPDPEKGVATPMGAYQVVGRTLQAAAKGLGLTGNEPFNEATQDRIGQWIYQTQGPSAWVGWGKGKGNGNMGRASGGGASTSSQGQMPPEMSDQDLPWLQRPKVQDTFDRLAIGFQGLTLNPNQALMQGAQDRIQSRAAKREASQQANKSAEWLAKNGMTMYADAVRMGVLTGKEAIALAKGPEATAAQQNYKFLIAQGMDPKKAMDMAFKSSGNTFNLGGDPATGKLSTDYAYVTDPKTGEVMRDANGVAIAAPVIGSPAWHDAQKRASAGGTAAEQTTRAGTVVLEDISRVEAIIKGSGLPVTGAIGGLLSKVPGTNAYDIGAMVMTIRGNIGFDRLQQMRDASPTGGALGAINQTELETLQSILGSLNQAQSEEQFLYNLERIGGIYKQIMAKAAAYPNASSFGFGGSMPSSGSSSGGGGRVQKYTEDGTRIDG